jgi:hypothetical protein
MMRHKAASAKIRSDDDELGLEDTAKTAGETEFRQRENVLRAKICLLAPALLAFVGSSGSRCQ